MKSEFDEIIDRRGTNSEKWSTPEAWGATRRTSTTPIQMWVADMDFRAPEPVLSALHEAITHGVFGYVFPSQSFIDAVIDWQRIRHGWCPESSWLLHTHGVVAGLSQIIRALTSENDAILVQTPVYGRFYKVPEANDRKVVKAPLKEADGCYVFDPGEFERIIKQHQPRLFILCHPHNPVGKVWTEAELRQMGEICFANNVLVVSDEIHQDFVLDSDKRHIPFASLGAAFLQNSIVCTSPSKTFNLAGLQVSNIFVANPEIRRRLAAELDRNGNHGVNSLGMVACEAAYRYGATWLDGLLTYIQSNHHYLSKEMEKIPGIRVFRSDALYLAWIDCRGLGMQDDVLDGFLREEAGVRLDSGVKFGCEGQGFVRLNLGCPRDTLVRASNAMKAAFQTR